MTDADKAEGRAAHIDLHVILRPPEGQVIGSTDAMGLLALALRDDMIRYLQARVAEGGFTLQVRDTQRII